MSNIIDNFARAMRHHPFIHCMRRLRAVAALSALLLPVCASRGQTLREAFSSMPDSLLPTLTKNNRLDMLDFMDAKMKAAVTNRLDGESVMTHLATDSIAIRMSDVLTVELTLAKADTTAVVSLKRTYSMTGGEQQTVVARYDARTWQELEAPTVTASTLQRFDEKITPTEH